MFTERDAYDVLIHMANKAGREGKKVYEYGIVLPRTTSDEYMVFMDAHFPQTTSESW